MKNLALLTSAAATLALVLGAGPIAVAKDKGHQITCPDTWEGAKCDYYKDGYKAGKSDRKANMSMAYERHADQYDSRFEEAFSVGYEAGWKGTSY